MLTTIANILRAIGLTWLANKLSPAAPDIAGGKGDRA